MDTYMTFPSNTVLRKAILSYLGDKQNHDIVKVTDKMAEDFKLTDDERAERTPVAKRLKFDVQVRWAVSQLRKAILLKNIENKLGIFKITQRGLNVLDDNPPIINDKYLKKFPEYLEWMQSDTNVKKIKKQHIKDKIYQKYGLVSYVDILGTKEFWTNSDSQNMPIKWNKLVKKFQKILEMTVKNDVKTTFNSFSDTMIITLESKNINYLLKKFGMAAWSMIPESIKLDMPIRGCFAIGKFFHEGDFFVGDAITEAAKYYERPQWIGITASPSAHTKIEKWSKQDPSMFTYYHRYPIPLNRSFEQEAWAIKWPELHDITNSYNGSSEDILNLINEKLENVTDVDVALKWRNTRKFYNDILNNPTNR